MSETDDNLANEIHRLGQVEAILAEPGVDAKTKALLHATAQIRVIISHYGDPYGALRDVVEECDTALGIVPVTGWLGEA